VNYLTDFEEKVLNLLETINKKLDAILNTNPSEMAHLKTEKHQEGYVKPSAVVEKQEEEEKALEKPPVEGRRVCPECGNTDFRNEEDKSQIMFQQGGLKIFKKRYICKRCGFEM